MRIPRGPLLLALVLPVFADEGMWLFNQFPSDQVQEHYSFAVTPAFLDNLRLASLRLAGASASFVSGHGLILAAYSAASACLAAASSPGRDAVRDGFYAASSDREIACPGVEADVLLGIEDVTGRVQGAASATAKPAEALEKRNAAIAAIEKTCARADGPCAVVNLFSGERYHLYRYRRYTDVRLVFAPETAIARFGGDADRFTYPRYALDIAFLRAYEDGRPAATPHFLRWSAEGVEDGEAVFVAGNPGSTSRLATAAQLAFYRDTSLPVSLERLRVRIGALRAFAAENPENARVAGPALAAAGNAYKSVAGKLIGLKDDRLMARKQNFEKKLRSAVEHDPKLGPQAGKVWDEIAAAYKSWTPFEKPYQVLEEPTAADSALFRMARQMVQRATGGARPGDTALAAPQPVSDALETALLARYLEELKALGEKEVPLKSILAGRTPQQAAAEMVHSTRLKDPAERRRLAADRGLSTQSDDPILRLARLLEEPARRLLKKRQETIEALETSSAERIARYRFRIFGAKDYPDATFTPRVGFGEVKAYRDKTEAPVPYATTFGGLYYRAGAADPNRLPQRWMDAKAAIDLVAPFNFVSTCDIAAGDAGSPTVNRKGELVGMVFDGNIESIAQTYLYMEEQARAVHVSVQGMTEALRKVYGASKLLEELR